ncbi:MAG: ATP-binding protein [Spirochaetota bacterium]|nr:ATP-binding protein [Spirochaetota bacterium]
MRDPIFSHCTKCIEELEAEEEKQKKEIQAETNKYFLSSIGISQRFYDSTFENYKAETNDQKKVLFVCKSYCTDFENLNGSALFMCGSFGTGKTHLAISILKELISSGKVRKGLYTSVMKLIRDIRSVYVTKEKTEQEMIDKYIKLDFLILDEVGVQMGSDNEKLLLFEVINGRYEEEKSTVLISNFNFDDLQKYIGARSMDRLTSKKGAVLTFSWESNRQK